MVQERHKAAVASRWDLKRSRSSELFKNSLHAYDMLGGGERAIHLLKEDNKGEQQADLLLLFYVAFVASVGPARVYNSLIKYAQTACLTNDNRRERGNPESNATILAPVLEPCKWRCNVLFLGEEISKME